MEPGTNASPEMGPPASLLATGPILGDGIHLGDLSAGMHGFTPAYGTVLAEAATVCLEEEQHTSGVAMKVTGTHELSVSLAWSCATEQQRRNWADPREATEYGAIACAILVARKLTGLQVTGQARKGTGFDWWLGAEPDAAGPFQNLARMEVSGIRKGDEAAIRMRVNQKQQQTTQSDATTSLPAWAVVVEFGGPQTRAVQR